MWLIGVVWGSREEVGSSRTVSWESGCPAYSALTSYFLIQKFSFLCELEYKYGSGISWALSMKWPCYTKAVTKNPDKCKWLLTRYRSISLSNLLIWCSRPVQPRTQPQHNNFWLQLILSSAPLHFHDVLERVLDWEPGNLGACCYSAPLAWPLLWASIFSSKIIRLKRLKEIKWEHIYGTYIQYK